MLLVEENHAGASTVRTPTTRCCTRRKICPVVVADEVSRCAMEAADGSKEEGIMVMPTAIADPPKIGGVDAEPRITKKN